MSTNARVPGVVVAKCSSNGATAAENSRATIQACTSMPSVSTATTITPRANHRNGSAGHAVMASTGLKMASPTTQELKRQPYKDQSRA